MNNSIGESIKRSVYDLENRNVIVSKGDNSDLDSKCELLGRVGKG